MAGRYDALSRDEIDALIAHHGEGIVETAGQGPFLNGKNPKRTRHMDALLELGEIADKGNFHI
jgi:hypothetical protein